MRPDVTHCRKRPRWEKATLLALLQQEQSRPGIEVQENRHTHDVEIDPPKTASPALGVMPQRMPYADNRFVEREYKPAVVKRCPEMNDS